LYCVVSAQKNLFKGTTKDGSWHRLVAIELALNQSIFVAGLLARIALADVLASLASRP